MKGLLERLKTSLPGRLATAYGQSKAGNYAAGLAFNAFMTMFPLILGLLSIVGIVFHDPGTEQRLQGIIAGVFPPDAQPQLMQAFKGIKNNVSILGIVSIAGLVWGGTSFFAAIEFALTQIFGTRQRDMFRQRLMGFVMMLVFLVALLLTAGANAAAGTGIPLGSIGGFVLGAIVLVVLLTVIYRFVPNRSFSIKDVWLGALISGVLVEVLSLVFPIYARLAHGFNTYGQQFGLFFLLATWLYLLSQLVLLGAVFNRMRLGPPSEEGMVSQPGDRGEIPPAPAEAIEAQRDDDDGEEQQPAAASGSRRNVAPSGSGGGQAERSPGRGDGSSAPRARSRAGSGNQPQGTVKRAAFAGLAAVIGLFALSRRPRSEQGGARRG